ncbi:hypothetical protein [Streptomyces sp. WM4235]|uniref:hypothetical protein n=1 Tax=Streptomyces sp. WM4235 TaxID=1415551 RepID=UPI0006AECFEC|nr:hypothetical protein [Streptomyces sp. WM4235]
MSLTGAQRLGEKLDYESLHSVIENLPKEMNEETVAGNLAMMKALSQPEVIAPILTEAIERDRLRKEIADRSYRHVNHFDKIVLIDTGNSLGYRLTLHLWAPPYTEEELNDEMIHDHRFSFWSSVLVGNLVSENFTRTTDGPSFQEYRYFPEKIGLSTMSNFYEFMGETGLTTTDPSRVPAGRSYFLLNESIHRVLLPRTETTCTLVLRSPRVRSYANVFNTAYPRTDTTMNNVMFTPEQLSQKVSDLVARIQTTR